MKQKGFSLIELLIAMTITLLICGAIFQLLSAGKGAFRKEPEMADRQQNIRMAIDLIAQDLYRAGYGLPPFAQALTDGLNGVGDGEGPVLGSGGEPTDVLEMYRAADCPPLQVCKQTGSSIDTLQIPSTCYTLPSLVIVGNSTTGDWGTFWAEQPSGPGAGNEACKDAYDRNGHVVFPHGQDVVWNPPGGIPFSAEWIQLGNVVRYRIKIDSEGTPNLERSPFGGRPDPDGNVIWEVIARGIEDLQVQYENGEGWHDEPGAIYPPDYDRLIRMVKVRLSARAMADGQFTGETDSAVGVAVRGQLETSVAPRAAHAALAAVRGEL